MLCSIYPYLATCREGDSLLIFTRAGKVYKVGFDKSSTAPSILFDKNESVVRVLKFTKEELDNPNLSLIFVSRYGMVKRTSISEFQNVLSNGKVATELMNKKGFEDTLKFVLKAREEDELFLVSSEIKSEQYILNRTVRCPVSSFRHQGRAAMGRRGILMDIKGGQMVIGATTTYEGTAFVTVDSAGYGKFTEVGQFRLFYRGDGMGVSCFKSPDEGRKCIACSLCNLDDEIIIETSLGKIYKRKVRELGRVSDGQIFGVSRTAVGIKLVRGDLEENETIVCCVK